MSVSTCAERRVTREGAEKVGAVQYRRKFLVVCTSEQDGAKTVLGAFGLPKLGDLYQLSGEIDTGAICVERTPRQIGPLQWEVDVLYDSSQEKKDEQDKEDEKPENWYIKLSVSHNGYQKPLLGAADSDSGVTQGFVNSAGDAFDPPPTYDASYPVLTYELAASIFPIDTCLKYMNAVNADVFFGGAAETWRIMDFSTTGVEEKQMNGKTIVYYPIIIRMEYRAETHKIKVLDIGPNYLSSGKKKAFLSVEGQPYHGLLAADGSALGAGAAEHFIEAQPYVKLPFGPLGLPQTFTPKAFR